jgi:hypothetical protein
VRRVKRLSALKRRILQHRSDRRYGAVAYKVYCGEEARYINESIVKPLYISDKSVFKTETEFFTGNQKTLLSPIMNIVKKGIFYGAP